MKFRKVVGWAVREARTVRCWALAVALCALSGRAVAEEQNTDVIQWALESVTYETFEAKHGSFVTADGAEMIRAYDARIAADAGDCAAYICRAFARMKTLGENEFFVTTMGKFGFSFSAETMHVTGELPSEWRQIPDTNEMVDDLCDIALPVLKAALDDFGKIPKDWSGCVEISEASGYQVDEPVFFDYADVLFAKAALCEMMSFLNILRGYNVSLDNRQLDDACNNRYWQPKAPNFRGVQAILKDNGGFMQNVSYPPVLEVLAEAQGWMASAAVLANAFDVAQANRTDGRNHFFMFAPGKKEMELADLVRRNAQSIIDLPYWTARVDLTPFADYLFTKEEKRDCLRGRTLDVTLRNFFEGRVNRYDTFPQFDGNFPLLDSNRNLPDATFSGAFPGMSRTKLGAYLELFGDIPPYEPDDTVMEYAALYDLPEGAENNRGNPATFAAGLEDPITLLAPSFRGCPFVAWSNDGVIPAGAAQAQTFEATFALPPEGNELNPWTIGAEGHEDDVKAWTNGEGRLVIEGRGALRVAMRNFANAADVPWADCADEVTEVTIAVGVTNVGKNAFVAIDNLRSINGEDVKSTYRTVSTVNRKSIERFNMMEDALGYAPLVYPSGTPEPVPPEPPAGALTTWAELTNAVATAARGAVIAVGADIDEPNGELVIPAGKSVTIKPCGKTVTCSRVTAKGSLTVGDANDSVGKIVALDGVQIVRRGGSITLLAGPLRGTCTAFSPGQTVILR